MVEVRTEKYCKERFQYLNENVQFSLLTLGTEIHISVVVNPEAVFHGTELDDYIRIRMKKIESMIQEFKRMGVYRINYDTDVLEGTN